MLQWHWRVSVNHPLSGSDGCPSSNLFEATVPNQCTRYCSTAPESSVTLTGIACCLITPTFSPRSFFCSKWVCWSIAQPRSSAFSRRGDVGETSDKLATDSLVSCAAAWRGVGFGQPRRPSDQAHSQGKRTELER